MSQRTDETPARRIRLTAEQREAQVFDIAEKLFTERGYNDVTMEDIARAAGVSRPIVYQHLRSKEDAYIACVRRARDQFEESMIGTMTFPLDDLTTRITAAGNAYFDLIATDPQRWSLLFATSAGLDGYLAEQLAELRAKTVVAIARAIGPYAPNITREAIEAFAQIISGIGEQLGRWWLTKPKMSKARVLSYYTTSIEGAARAMLELPHAQKQRRKSVAASGTSK